MATYYISPNGSDASNGLGPDASAAANKPWLTVGKAMNTGSTVVPGDTVYLAPGYYYSEVLVPIAGITSIASPTAFRADPTNAQGFKTSGGVRVAPGLCWVTARTSGEGLDAIMASATTLVNGGTNGAKGLQFYGPGLVLEAKVIGGACITLSAATNTDWLFQGVRFVGQQAINMTVGTVVVNHNLTIRRCVAVVSQALLNVQCSGTPATADIDINWVIESNLVLGRLTGNMTLCASGGNLAGGIKFKGNTSIAGQSLVHLQTTALRCSTVTPITVEGSVMLYGSAASAGTSGHIIDSGYNRYLQTTASTNFTIVGTSVDGYAPNMVLPDLFLAGLELPRPDWIGWTDAAVATQAASAWVNANPDIRGQTARPWKGGASIGCWEANPASQDTASAITGGGGNSLKLTGAGELSLFVPVSAAATTITVVTKSSLYGGASYPQLTMEASPAIGVTQTTATATDASEQTLTVGPFTPTAAGVIELRLISRSSATNSATWFDLLAAS